MYKDQSGKVLFPCIILVLVLMCGYFYLPDTHGNTPQFKRSATQVLSETAITQTKDIILEAVGSARANQAINITSAQSDYITALYFNDGDTVKQGDILVSLLDKQEQLSVDTFKINLKEQKRQLKRLEELARSQSTAQSQLETQRSVVDNLTAQLRSALSKAKEFKVTAPFDGILGKRQVSVGSFVTNNRVITTLDDINIIKVDFKVPEKYLSLLNIGMKVTLSSDAYAEQLFDGEVSHIESRIDVKTRSVEVTASVANTQGLLRPGMLLHVAIKLNNLTAIMLPEKSIIPRQNKHFVFIIDDNSKAQQVEVDILTRFKGMVAIKQGVSEGQRVITEGTMKIRSGSTVVEKG